MPTQRGSDSQEKNFAGVPFFDTGPERQVQQLLRRSSIPFQTHVRELPGLPDIVVSGSNLVILVHGCFWHRHACRNGRRMPQKRRARWAAAFQKRIEKDRAVERQLHDLGWRVLVVWECRIRDDWDTTAKTILDSIGSSHPIDRPQSSFDIERHGRLAPSPIRDTLLTPQRAPAMHSHSSKLLPLIWAVYTLLLLIVMVVGYLIGSQKAALDRVAAYAKDTNSETQAAKERFDEIHMQIKNARLDLTSVNEQLDPLRAEHRALNTTVVQKNADLAQAEANLADAETRRDNARESLAEIQAATQSANLEFQKAENARINAERQAQDAARSLREAQARLQSAEQGLTSAQARLEQLGDEVRDKETEQLALHQEAIASSRDLAEIQRQLTAAEALIEQGNIAKSDLGVLSVQRDDLRAELSSAQSGVASARSTLDRMNEAVRGLEIRETTLTSSIRSLETEVARLEKDQGSSKSLLATFQGQSDRLGGSISHLQAEKERLVSENTELEQQTTTSRSALQSVESEIARVRRELESENQRVQAARLEFARLDNDRATAREEIDVYEKRRDGIRRQLIENRASIAEAGAQEQLANEVSALSDSLGSLVRRLTQMAERLDEQLAPPENQGEGANTP